MRSPPSQSPQGYPQAKSPGTCSIFIPTSLKPLLSKRWITSPTSLRCTPSGFTATRVRSRVQEGPPLEEGGSGLPRPHPFMSPGPGFPCQDPGVTWTSECLPQAEQLWRGVVWCPQTGLSSMVLPLGTSSTGGPWGLQPVRGAMGPPRQWQKLPMIELMSPEKASILEGLEA